MGGSVVDRPTQLICISDLYLLSWRWRPLWSGGTLYQWSLRLKKTQLGPIFFQNIRVIYKLSVKKQETGQKTGKKPPKKGVFLSSSDQLLWQCHESCQLLLQCHESWQLLLHCNKSWQLSWQCHKSCSTMSATKVGNFRGTATKVGQRS